MSFRIPNNLVEKYLITSFEKKQLKSYHLNIAKCTKHCNTLSPNAFSAPSVNLTVLDKRDT